MADWWTYRLEDFLLFSPATYYRGHELYNAEIWPLQVVALVLGGLIPVLAASADVQRRRAAAALLALAWCWVGWGFHFSHYATINWAAPWFGAAFVLEAGLLLWIGVVRGALVFRPRTDLSSRIGLALFVFALVGYPMLELALGRPWTQLGVFGTSPDPTVLATLGMVLMTGAVRGARLATLLAVPLAWCVVGGATLWAMGAPAAWLLPAVGALAVVLVVVQVRRRRADN